MDNTDGKKSVLRSIRVSSRLAASLEREAREAKISVNSLVSSILERHDEWGKQAERFGFVHISRDLFGQFLDAIDDDDLALMAREFGRSMSTDLIVFWFKEVSLESVLRYLSLLSEYQKLFTLDLTELHGSYVIIAHHAFGEKGSVWFLNFLREAVETNLGVTTSAKHTKTSVRIEIPVRGLERTLTDARAGELPAAALAPLPRTPGRMDSR